MKKLTARASYLVNRIKHVFPYHDHSYHSLFQSHVHHCLCEPLASTLHHKLHLESLADSVEAYVTKENCAIPEETCARILYVSLKNKQGIT